MKTGEKLKSFRLAPLGPAFLAVSLLAFAPQLRSQEQSQSQQQQSQQSQSQQSQSQQAPVQTARPSLAHPGVQQSAAPSAPKVDPKEQADFKAFLTSVPKTAAELDTKIQAGEGFLKTYPTSVYRENVYALLANEYFTRGQLDNFQKNEVGIMMSDSDMALALNPNDLTVLTLLGKGLPRTDSKAADFPQKLAKAENCNQRVLDLLPKIKKPASLSDDQFTKIKAEAASDAHSGLGVVYFREGKFQQSTEELQKANDPAVSPDPTNYFVLGIDFEQMKNFAEAAKAYDSCAQIQSSLQDRCKQSAAKAKAQAGGATQSPKP